MNKNVGSLTVDGRELMSKIHIRIRMPRLLGFRLWLTAKLIAAAGWTSGTTITVEMDEDAPE